jgi:hypothetical protein
MAWAVDHPQRRGWRRGEVGRDAAAPADVRTVVAPIGASLAGTLSVLVGAWGAICVYVGPLFGYRPTSYNAWEWTTQNWLLHLVPGAVGFVAGLLIIEETRRRKVGAGGTLSLPALMLMAAGIWFVIGPAVWPTFESGPAFRPGVSAGTAALNMIGSSLGPGLLLAIFGGVALKAAVARPAVAVDTMAAPAAVGDPAMAASTAPAVADTRAGERVVDPAGRAGDPMVDPAATRAGEPMVDPAARAREPMVDPAVTGTTRTGEPMVDPANRAGEPMVDPAATGTTRTGEPMVDPAAGGTTRTGEPRGVDPGVVRDPAGRGVMEPGGPMADPGVGGTPEVTE